MIPSPEIFEKLASFYLGRSYDLETRQLGDELTMYDARDLCTHAMCVGMTGSGKTGLCLSLLEEAAIDGIPAICIDPKGDLANLMLAFPDLKPDDFKPWIHASEASRKGQSVDEFAKDRAKLWKDGLAQWGQTPQRIAKFRDAVDINIFTPGSNIGLPITVLKSFDAPSPEVIDDSEAMSQLVSGAASGLLTLMGIDADPLLSREHILIASILDNRWRAGKNVSIGGLIGLISSPPIERVGVLDLETFMPASDRSKLAMRLNNLLASPAFASWLEGSPLSIKDLLHSPDGKPRLSILSIAHLSDRERMFFVTILLNEILAWMRTQSGTSSLRAMLYMDEVAGYFPPVSNPPSKPPMLTLLKQARAFGLGVTLATQNPVDLDYKGLSNIGTWFLGRLQTERDKARVIEGLEGAAVQTGAKFDRATMQRMLASLGNRVFLMNNVHEDGPTVFQTRWAMSYLAGPLARDQISKLMEPKRAAIEKSADKPVKATPSKPARPVVPAGIDEQFLPSEIRIHSAGRGDGGSIVYRPAIYADATLRYIRASADLDQWRDLRLWVDCARGVPDDPWEDSKIMRCDTEPLDEPEPGIQFGKLPIELCNKSAFRSFAKQLKNHLYRHHTATLFKSPVVDGFAPPPGPDQPMDEATARAIAMRHFEQAAREELDLQTEKLRSKFADKMASLDKKIRAAEQRLSREESQYEQAKMSSLISIGSSLLGAFMGRKMASRTNVSRVGTAARAGSRAMQQRDDIGRAEDVLRDLAEEQTELDAELREQIEDLTREYSRDALELESVTLPPRKSDLKVSAVALLWMPWHVDQSGIATPAFEQH